MSEDGWVNLGKTEEGLYIYATLEEFLEYLDALEKEDNDQD